MALVNSNYGCSVQDIVEPEARAAFVWILGEYGQSIQVRAHAYLFTTESGTSTGECMSGVSSQGMTYMPIMTIWEGVLHTQDCVSANTCVIHEGCPILAGASGRRFRGGGCAGEAGSAGGCDQALLPAAARMPEAAGQRPGRCLL